MATAKTYNTRGTVEITKGKALGHKYCTTLTAVVVRYAMEWNGMVLVLLWPEMEAKAANVPGNYKRQ